MYVYAAASARRTAARGRGAIDLAAKSQLQLRTASGVVDVDVKKKYAPRRARARELSRDPGRVKSFIMIR